MKAPGLQLPLFNPLPDCTMPDLGALPTLRGRGPIAVDLETYDPNLMTTGPGWPFGDGWVCGIALAVEGLKIYLPIAHAEGPLLDINHVTGWLRDQLSCEQDTKIFANAQYDLGWLSSLGVPVIGPIFDVLTAAALINEREKSYSLDAVSTRFLGVGKDERGLNEVAIAYGVKRDKVKGSLWRLPAAAVAQYAETDAHRTLDLASVLERRLWDEGLSDVWRLEMALVPHALRMRARGVRVCELTLAMLETDLAKFQSANAKVLRESVGFNVDIWSNNSVKKAFESAGAPWGMTANGAPSFTKPFLKSIAKDHPVAQLVLDCREVSKLQDTFVEGLKAALKRGRVHPQINLTKGEKYGVSDGVVGTGTGRISYSTPNLQQAPRRSVLGRRIRECFIPEPGQKWLAGDFNQQEVRLLIHYAARLGLRGAQRALQRFTDNHRTDYHKMVGQLASIERGDAKTINFSIAYGAGPSKVAAQLGMSLRDATPIIAKYNAAIPYAKEFLEFCSMIAQERGYVKTILGRRSRYQLFEPDVGIRESSERFALPWDQARAKWPLMALKRAFTYRAGNAVIQGSAAEQTKRAWLDLAEAGYLPLLQVHDEFGLSGEPSDTSSIKQIMENAISLTVPSIADVNYGDNWNAAKG